MKLICVRGLVPNILDAPEWRDLIQLLCPRVHIPSSTTFLDKIIPQEAVYVREKTIELLQDLEILVLTFDGTGTRKPEGLYTTHVTTPDHRSYFVHGYDGAGEHHTSDWIKDKLLKVSANRLGFV